MAKKILEKIGTKTSLSEKTKPLLKLKYFLLILDALRNGHHTQKKKKLVNDIFYKIYQFIVLFK